MKPLLRKKIVTIGLILFLLTLTLPQTTAYIKNHQQPQKNTYGTTHYVGGNGTGNYTYIQDAIDNATDGDTIYVFNGTYNENLSIDKQLTIQGQNKTTTIIDTNVTWEIITILADNVILTNFTIQKTPDYYYGAGIDIYGNHTTITENIIQTTGYGLYLRSNNNHIQNNEFINNGIYIEQTNIYQNTFINNSVNGKQLIYLEETQDLTLSTPAGQIILIKCTNITVQNQELLDTSHAIYLNDCTNCNIINNTIKGTYYTGIYLIHCDSCNIINNTITANFNVAIQMTNTDNCILADNDLYSNYNAALAFFYCTLNTIERNNFANNIIHVFSLFGNLNNWARNYWNRARLLPKLIIEFPRLSFDWYPAKEPYL